MVIAGFLRKLTSSLSRIIDAIDLGRFFSEIASKIRERAADTPPVSPAPKFYPGAPEIYFSNN